MNGTASAHEATTTAGAPKQRNRRTSIAVVAPWLLVAALFTSQVATLLSERAHDAAFSALASVVSLAGASITEAALAQSPSRVKAKAVDKATRQLQAEVTDIRTRNRALQADVDAVKTSKAALSREHEALKTLTARRAVAVRELSARTVTSLAGRAKYAIKTLPVRAAPYVGIAAAVYFTAHDLKADCALAKTIAQLSEEHGNAPVDTGEICTAADQVPSPQQAWSAIREGSGAAWLATSVAIEKLATSAGLALDTKKLP